jgi:hypothetical protein
LITILDKKLLFNFWLLVQHQDLDLSLQINCLKNCGFENKEFAYLTDRVLVNRGEKQIYGTQLNAKIENLSRTNNLRKKIGMMTMKQDLIKINKTQKILKQEYIELKLDSKGGAKYVFLKRF